MNSNSIKDIFKVLSSNLMIVISGIISGFILPKILGVTDYGYYKIFNLYITYVVFFDLGISNGLYLKYGGYYLSDLPLKKFREFFSLFLKFQILSAVVIISTSILFFDGDYKFIFPMVAIYMVFNNIATYFEKVSIMTGDFDAAVRRNILKSILTFFIILILSLVVKILPNINKYQLYTILFVSLYALLAIQYSITYKQLIIGDRSDFKSVSKEIIVLIKTGFILLMADMIASLILTLDRQFVSMLFDIDTYSLYSFAYSMLRIVVIAVSAVASVLYPSLKRMSKEKMIKSYDYSLSIIEIISFACLLAYYPLCEIVRIFLPNYVDSLDVFRILFPSISINSIISMIMVNHYKVLGYQKKYFLITIEILILAFVSNIVAYGVSKDPIGFAIASVITMMIWYIISDVKLRKIYNAKSYKQLVYVVVNMVIFYTSSWIITNNYFAFFINLIIFAIVSIVIYKNELKTLLQKYKE